MPSTDLARAYELLRAEAVALGDEMVERALGPAHAAGPEDGLTRVRSFRRRINDLYFRYSALAGSGVA